MKKFFVTIFVFSLIFSTAIIKNSTKIVKIIKDIESCPKLNIKGLKATSSVKKLITEAGGTLEE